MSELQTMPLYAVIGSAILALVFAAWKSNWVSAQDAGTDKMKEIAGHIAEGAMAFLSREYRVLAVFVFAVAILLGWSNASMEGSSGWIALSFVVGASCSAAAGYFGMKIATKANVRTTAAARTGLNKALEIAFAGGSVMGLVVVGLGVLGLTVLLHVYSSIFAGPAFSEAGGVENYDRILNVLAGFSLGASSIALFARVGGGIYTKAADVGADLVGKVEAGIPEDDPRNPATIADNVGDNVGDVAGMGADLYESYCGSILATAALGVAAFASEDMLNSFELSAEESTAWQLKAMFLPMVIAAVGIFLSIIGILMVKSDEDASQKSLLKALARGINISTILVIVAALGCTYLLMGSKFIGISFSVTVGLLAGWLIGKWTEYCTSDEFRPTRALAEQAKTGPATVIIGGIADGMKSVWVPVMVICAATLLAFGGANGFDFKDVSRFTLGLYGVGIAAVGMLSTLGITLATDAYGPIADNAGGNAEMAGLEPIVRERTDALDSLGNTTAATGKGFAIGSAALTALALLAAYVEEVRIGFERWAEDPAVITSSEIGYYKVNERLVILKDTGTDRENPGEIGATAWLVFPEQARKAEWGRIASNTAVPFLKDMSSVVSGSISSRRTLTLDPEAGEEVMLVSARKATLPDYATYYDAQLMNPKILVGVFIGCMATFVFCAMTMQAVGRAAQGMVNEVRRQFKENPGIMDGSVIPDYAAPVTISTKAAQKEMILPSLLGLCTPIVTGLLLGVGGVLGLLVGTMTCGFCVAIFMANAGGSWDNAKKYIEAGNFGGKGSEAHKAGVVGDTVGDPFKDTSGPSLNILIKLMSMVSVVMAGLIVRYSLMAIGVF